MLESASGLLILAPLESARLFGLSMSTQVVESTDQNRVQRRRTRATAQSLASYGLGRRAPRSKALRSVVESAFWTAAGSCSEYLREHYAAKFAAVEAYEGSQGRDIFLR
jgi:hypothetical protein